MNSRQIGDSNNMDNSNVRWAFNASSWQPTLDQILAASSYIQQEEKERITRFVFQDDAKSSLIGRLMMRKFVHDSTLLPYENIHFQRDDRGKPYLANAGDIPINFNVSHQGDYVVLAGNTMKNIGIDVMKIEPPVNKNIPEFFRIMKRQFSETEWSKILSYPTELKQIACFYRMWCLKESYVKNIGIGITIPLDKISFSVKSELKVGDIVSDTTLYVNNTLKEDWLFEETLLDDRHAVAVSFQQDRNVKTSPVPYDSLSFDDIVRDARPLVEPDATFAGNFISKELKKI